MENTAYTNIPKEKFEFADARDISHDKKLETKPRSYMRDAFSRFCKNKGSVVGACVILFWCSLPSSCPSSRSTPLHITIPTTS